MLHLRKDITDSPYGQGRGVVQLDSKQLLLRQIRIQLHSIVPHQSVAIVRRNSSVSVALLGRTPQVTDEQAYGSAPSGSTRW